MLFKEAEARLAELLNRYAREDGESSQDQFQGVCQINGSNNRVIIHVHYACCEDVLEKMGDVNHD